MEITFGTAESVGAHAFGRTGYEFESRMHNQKSVGTNQFGEMCEALEVSLFGAVNVEMVGVGGVDYCYVRRELVERAVEFIGFYYAVRRCGAEHEIAVVAFENAAEKSVAARTSGMQHMGRH